MARWYVNKLEYINNSIKDLKLAEDLKKERGIYKKELIKMTIEDKLDRSLGGISKMKNYQI